MTTEVSLYTNPNEYKYTINIIQTSMGIHKYTTWAVYIHHPSSGIILKNTTNPSIQLNAQIK